MWYWTAAAVLIAANAMCVFANLFLIPGNWLMLGTMCVFLLVTDAVGGPTWTTVAVTGVLAMIGEILEMLGGTARAARRGASRRTLLLSFAFTVVGSIGGTFLIPVPVIGTAAGAMIGAALGAYGGAWMGEAWSGSDTAQRSRIGQAALSGRLLGMLAKIGVGMAIFVFQTIMLWL